MTPFRNRFARRFGASSRRQVLRGLLGAAAAALTAALPRGIARATDVASYCADTPEQEFLTLINTYRAANGRGTLRLAQHIGAAGQHHSTDMANRNYLSHTTLGSSDGPRERMVAHGYPANTTWWGENIYAGYGVQNGVDLGSAQGAFNWWRNSSGHNANMLNANYTVIGIDRYSNPSSQYRNYWTTDFGGVTDQAATLCGGTPPPPTPTRLTITGHSQSANSNSASAAYDGSASTYWRSNSGAPSSAWAPIRPGQRARHRRDPLAVQPDRPRRQFTIQASSNGSSWQTLATRGNAPAGAWQTLATAVTARYVRFSFSNPNRDNRVGYLSEVQLYGPATALTTRRADALEAPAGADQASVPRSHRRTPAPASPASASGRARAATARGNSSQEVRATAAIAAVGVFAGGARWQGAPPAPLPADRLNQ